MAFAASLLLAAVTLVGVTGESLRARAFFDANNVTVGDPLVLTVDFLGKADFAALHPPALARQVNRRDWKVDDDSAKTDTFRDARRLTYRVRPLHDGVLWFPEIEFSYTGADGAKRIVRSNAIPVHARPGSDVVVAGMREDTETYPQPDDWVEDPGVALSDDDMFAWRKALATPTADAFAAFDFPAARLNEARAAFLAGAWARALKVYARLEWRTGQTPAIERGIVAALAQRYQNPAVELPVWRQVLRPLLGFAWLGRVLIVVGTLLALALLFWILGRAIRALAGVALMAALLAPQGAAADIFDEMEAQMQQMRQQMNQSLSLSFGGGVQLANSPSADDLKAALRTDVYPLQVGSAFNFIVSIDMPRGTTLENIRFAPSEWFGATMTGEATPMKDLASANPSNVIRRFSVPVRYDVPLKTRLSFRVSGMRTSVVRRRFGSSRFSTSFSIDTPEIPVEIRPLPTAGQPADFSGVIADRANLIELPDLLKVGTNDVITITYRLSYNGYVPDDFMPPGAAYEWGRALGTAEWKRYLVADGTNRTPRVSFSYYDPKTKTYKRAAAGGTEIRYE